MRRVSRSHVRTGDRHARHWTGLCYPRAAVVLYRGILKLHLTLLSQNALSHTGSVLLCSRISCVACRVITIGVEGCVLTTAIVLVEGCLVLTISGRAVWRDISGMRSSSGAECTLTSLLMGLLVLSLQVNVSQAFGRHFLDLFCRGLRELCLKLVSD